MCIRVLTANVLHTFHIDQTRMVPGLECLCLHLNQTLLSNQFDVVDPAIQVVTNRVFTHKDQQKKKKTKKQFGRNKCRSLFSSRYNIYYIIIIIISNHMITLMDSTFWNLFDQNAHILHETNLSLCIWCNKTISHSRRFWRQFCSTLQST